MEAAIGYARSGEVNIAYQVTGEGPLDLVLVSGFVSHLDDDWQYPSSARLLERLGSFARLIRFDKRGTGLSDRAVGLPGFETRMDDVCAVVDADRGHLRCTGHTRSGPGPTTTTRDARRRSNGPPTRPRSNANGASKPTSAVWRRAPTSRSRGGGWRARVRLRVLARRATLW